MGGLAKLAVDSFGAGGQWFPDAQSLASELVRALAASGTGAATTDAATSSATATGGADSTAASGARLAAAGAADPTAAAPGIRLLIKGSRVNRLERVVDTLVHGSIQQTSGH